MPSELDPPRRCSTTGGRSIGWCLGIVGYTLLTSSIFPSFKGSPDLTQLVERYPDALKALFGISGGGITTGAGYTDAELFSLMLPLIVLVLAIGSGARAFAGEEDAGRLELLLSYPLRRRDAVVAKGVAVAVEVVLVCSPGSAHWPCGAWSSASTSRWDGSRRRWAHSPRSASSYGWLALALGAAIPSKVLALGVPAAFAAAAYLVGGLYTLAGWLEPFRVLSPFWLVGQSPLQNGVDGWGILVVLAAAVVALGAGALLVERRDLQTP